MTGKDDMVNQFDVDGIHSAFAKYTNQENRAYRGSADKRLSAEYTRFRRLFLPSVLPAVFHTAAFPKLSAAHETCA